MFSKQYGELQQLRPHSESPWHHRLQGLNSAIHELPKYTLCNVILGNDDVSSRRFGIPTFTSAIQTRRLSITNIRSEKKTTVCDQRQADSVSNIEQRKAIDIRELVS